MGRSVEESSSLLRAGTSAVINVTAIYTDGVETTKFCTVRGPWWAPITTCRQRLFTSVSHKVAKSSPYICSTHFIAPRRNVYRLPAISLFVLFLLPTIHAGRGEGNTVPFHATKHDGKVTPLQAWTGPYGSRSLRLPEFLDNRHMVIRSSAIRTGSLYPRGDIPGIHYC